MDLDSEIFKFVAGIDILAVLFILWKINLDTYRHNFAKDAVWIYQLRNIGFGLMATMLGIAIWHDGSRRSILWLFYSASFSIYVNALALNFRKEK
jgi:hypothetical protein